MKQFTLYFILLLTSFLACKKKNEISLPTPKNPENNSFLSAVDISSYPEINLSNPAFYDQNGQQKDFLAILKENGVNTVRLRLWVNPNSEHSGFNEVKEFSRILKNEGFKTWLTLHYSDTWADPAHQETPSAWQNKNFDELKDSVFAYTQKIVADLQPNYIQIGNEINSGFLHPQGHISNEFQQFETLLNTAAEAVRKTKTDCQIILHFAGIRDADWFFNLVKNVDYDIIGLSYYPIWHGKDLDSLKMQMNYLSQTYNRKIVIAETAYPFTLDWNDWTNNIVGAEDQLILPDYPASIQGQKDYLQKMKTITKEVDKSIGFCYWGAELIAWKGNQSTQASPWENQSLFDFQNKALPVLEVFKGE